MLGVLCACSTPDVSLWTNRPTQIEVKEEMIVPGDVFGAMKIYLPAGIYRYSRSDALGFVYETDAGMARAIDKGLVRYEKSFRPAIVLYNRSDEVLIMQIAHSLEEIGSGGGETGNIVLRKAIEKDGYVLVPRSRGLSRPQRLAIGIPATQR